MTPTNHRVPLYSMTAAVKRSSNPDGTGPCAKTIATYIRDGVLQPVPQRDSRGHYLFTDEDCALIRQIYRSRQERHGKTGRRAVATVAVD